jgi:GNAT superfamily N-acetyltransferase
MDLLVPLYRIDATPHAAPLEAAGVVVVRPPIGPEHDAVVAWVGTVFGAAWASEARVALQNRPVSLRLAMASEGPVGFACFDATARGMFGPIGVLPAWRGKGVGALLLQRVLAAMRDVGYAYAVIGAPGPADFFKRLVPAMEIADSQPGLYAGMMKPSQRA